MNDKNKNYTFDDDENDDIEITEYLERELVQMEHRERKPQQTRTRTPQVQQARTRTQQSGRTRQKAKAQSEKKKPGVVLFYEQNKLKVLWSAFGVLVVLLIIALIVTNIGKNKDDEKQPESKIAEEEQTTAEQTTEAETVENAFEAEPEDSPYIQVCSSFLKSTYVEWNDETLSQICDNTQNLSKDNFAYLNKYIEDIENVNCYVGYETEDGKILIFVTYNIKFANISTTAPTMEAVVLVKSEDTDSYLIHNFEVGDEMDLYTSNVQNNPNYLDLCSNINAQLDAALESDEDLKKVYDALKNSSAE